MELPNSREAEEAVLGALIIDPGLLPDLEIAPEDFYIHRNRWIYEAMRTIHDGGGTPDMVTLSERLNASGHLGEIGGPAYLVGLFNATPTSMNAGQYAEIVRNYSRRRHAAQIANDLARAAYNLEEDLEGAIVRVKGDLDKNILTAAGDVPSFADQGLAYLARLRERRVSIPFHLPKLNRAFGGMWRKNLYILCARPGIGKTALLLNVARHAARDYRVLFQSLEMSVDELIQRMACADLGLDSRLIGMGEYTEAQEQAITDRVAELIEMYEGKLFIYDTERCNTQQMRRNVAAVRPDLALADHIRLFADENKDDVRRLGDITWRLKQIAKEFDVPVLAASQLNRKVEDRQDKMPTLADIRGSGEIEENADVVMGLTRNVIQGEKPPKITEARIGALKFRNGPDVLVRLAFNGEKQEFYEQA